MKSKKRITHAYCVQAGEVMSITDARQFYFSSPRRESLSFFCSTQKCRDLGVKVTGANYHIPPQEESSHPVAHYKANPVDEHDPSCEWVGAEDALTRRPGESAERLAERKAKRKLKDHIDYFDPSGKDAESDPARGNNAEYVAGSDVMRSTRGVGVLSDTRHATNSLERLVQCYLEAKKSLSDEEFEALTLNVKGIGIIPLRAYFRSMQNARLGENDRVLVGGARYKEYGRGFRFDFYDEHRDKPIALYVSPKAIESYRFRRYWWSLFEQAENVKYFRVYVLGSLKERESGKGYDVVVDDLRHIAITLGPEKTR